ncbi:MAG: winged helix-turn-helix transcriptional regulator, partial [Candidatus Thorarchaeota archaeon]
MNPVTKGTVKISQIMEKAPERYRQKNYNEVPIKKFDELIPNTIPKMIKEDISFYFDYLRNDRNESSLNKWEKTTGCTDSPISWKVPNYRPIFSFLYYDRITDGHFLPLLLKKIETTIYRANELTIPEFNRLCRLSIVGFRPPIDTIDLKILQALSYEPSLVAQAITDRISHSYATVYNHLQMLKAKMGLRVTTRINWA